MTDKRGFTLAEVLITLGVIGVVSAITLPTLIHNYNKKVWATGLKKAYSTASQTCNLIMAKEQVNNLGDTDFFNSLHHHSDFENTAKKYFANAQIRRLSSAPATYYYRLGNHSSYYGTQNFEDSWNDMYSIEFPSFTYYVIAKSETPYIHEGRLYGSYVSDISFYVDVNGAGKKPNRMTNDVFKFNLDYKCSLKEGSKTSNCYNGKTASRAEAELESCFFKVMEDGWEIKYDI